MRNRRLTVEFDNISGEHVEASLLIPDVRTSRKLSKITGTPDGLIADALDALDVRVEVDGHAVQNDDLGVDEVARIWSEFNESLLSASNKPTK